MFESTTPTAPVTSTPTETPVTTPQSTPTDTATPEATVAAAVVNDPNASKAQKQEAKKMLKKLSLKVDGEEFEENLPFEIPDDPKAIEYMRRELQLAKMGQKRAQHAASIEKDVSDFLTLLKSDPIAALTDPNIGLDVKALAEKVMLKEIEDSKKTPEQKELEEAKKQLKELKERQEKEAKERDAADQQRQADKLAEEFDTQITQALDGQKIPRTPAAVKKVIDYAQLAVQAGKNVSIADIIPFVQEELSTDFRGHAESLNDDQLLDFMGQVLTDRVRKITVAKAKKTAANPAVQAPNKVANTGKKAEPEKNKEEKVSYKSFFGRGV